MKLVCLALVALPCLLWLIRPSSVNLTQSVYRSVYDVTDGRQASTQSNALLIKFPRIVGRTHRYFQRGGISELVHSQQLEILRLGEVILRMENEGIILEAAQTLVQMDTVEAVGHLIQITPQLENQGLKHEIAEMISKIRNRDTIPLMMQTIIHVNDPVIIQSAQSALGEMAGEEDVRQMLTNYQDNPELEYKQRIEDTLRNLQSPEAASPLIEIASQNDMPLTNSLMTAVVDGLSHIGTTTTASSLLQKLEVATDDEPVDGLFKAITNIKAPHALSALQYAAEGNKEATLSQTRAAAIYALRNYPAEETVGLLETLANEQDSIISDAAKQTLAMVQPGGQEQKFKSPIP